MRADDNFPIIIGVGQVVDHWEGQDPQTAPHPATIIKQAIDAALSDTGVAKLARKVDCAAFIRTFSDSLPMPFNPFGKITNLPHAVINLSDISPKQIVYSTAGGEQPQALVAELSEKLHAGDIEFGLIAGGEVTGAIKTAMKKNLKLDWAVNADGDMDDRGAKTDFISPYEIKNGLGMPPQTYVAMEQALRARLGMSKAEYLTYIGQMLSNLSKVAQANPYAQFPTFRTPEFLTTPSKENYRMFEPYLKWHMAQDAVNQAAALVLTTVAKARECGVSEDKWVYLHGYSKVEDGLVSQRPDLSKSDAIELTINRALETSGPSGLSAKDITHRDIYSCFPVVLHLAAECLGLDPTKDQMSVTGGLPFFGGAGNNYSTHGIVSLIERLRTDRKTYGIVLANGGYMSKEAVGIYSARAPEKWGSISSERQQLTINERPMISLIEEDCTAVIETYCIKYDRDGPASGYIIAQTEKGRVIANIQADDKATLKALLDADNVVGRNMR